MAGSILQSLGRYNFVPHAHECKNPRCGMIWAHDPGEDHNELTFEDAHTCPNCGSHQGRIYDGTRPPEMIHDGLHQGQVVREPVRYIEESEEYRHVPGTDLTPREYTRRRAEALPADQRTFLEFLHRLLG